MVQRRSCGCSNSSATGCPMSDATSRIWLACSAARLAIAGCAQKYGTTRRLLRKALEETIDNQAPETVAHEVHAAAPPMTPRSFAAVR